MNALQVFSFKEGRKVRSLMRDGNPWFVAKDVCDVLEIQNSRDTVAKLLPENEKGVDTIYTLGGNQTVQIVNEPGLYRLVFQSRKPEAEAFKTWVFTVVLPSIRKTGSYHVSLDNMDADTARTVYNNTINKVQKYNLEHEEKLRIFFDLCISLTGNKNDYFTTQAVYEKYVREYDFDEVLSRCSFTYRFKKLFPGIQYGLKKVDGYPYPVFYGIRLLF